MKKILYILIPCYNEEEVLPVTFPLFQDALKSMIKEGLVSEESRILYVDDGSSDNTWKQIVSFMKENSLILGLRLEKNCGHQKALWKGLLYAKDSADLTITIDCDGQDDIGAMKEMVEAFHKGNEIVYGVRSDRSADSFLKRTSAQNFYKLMNHLGAGLVYNHADYRLLSNRMIRELENFEVKDLFLRGMVPKIQAQSTVVYYERIERMAGETKYSLWKMMGLAWRGMCCYRSISDRNKKR